MTRRKRFILLVGMFATLLCCSIQTRAQVLTRLQIDISTAPGGATVNGQTGLLSTGSFDINFGNVDGLGIGARPAGVSVTRQSGGAFYSTPILLTPLWIALAVPLATVTPGGPVLNRRRAQRGS